MLPLCTLIPVPLLSPGEGTWPFTRGDAAGRRVDGHRISGIAVEALFWIRLIHLLGSSIDFRFLPDYPSWHALDFSAGFLIVGAAMTGVLLSAPSPEPQPTPPGA
jgi:hypothetical protein